MSTNDNTKPTNGPMPQLSVSIDWDVYQKIMYWVRKATGEVSGLGKVTIVDGHFRVVSACLVKQENGAASTDMDAAAVAKAMYELREAPGHLNFWWHSHVNMAVFWSGTDTNTIREIGSNGWLLSTVFNKKNEHRTAFYSKAQGELPEIFLDNLTITTPKYLKQSEIDAWEAEYAAKTVTKTYSYTDSRGTWNQETGRMEYRKYTLQDTHDWKDGAWVPKKKNLTKKEKKALRLQEKEASTKSSTATVEQPSKDEMQKALDLKLVLDDIAGDFYNDDITFKEAQDTLEKVIGLITTSDLTQELKDLVAEEYELEFHQLFKEDIMLEDQYERELGYPQ